MEEKLSRRGLFRLALAAPAAYLTGYAGCGRMREYKNAQQQKELLEERIRVAPTIPIDYGYTPGFRLEHDNVVGPKQGPTLYLLARQELHSIGAPSYVGDLMSSEKSADLVLRRIKQLNPNYSLGKNMEGLKVPDLNNDGKFGVHPSINPR